MDISIYRKSAALIAKWPKTRIFFLMIACLVFILNTQSCTVLLAPIGNYAANKVYPDLAQPNDMEAPPTYKQYLTSPSTQAILGGRGGGLNCSIPWGAKGLFETSEQSAPASLHFRSSCVMHDLCYRHGYATYGYSQSDCDQALQASAFRMCRQIHKIHKNMEDSYEKCQTEAKKILLGVSIGGAGSFQAFGKSTYFEYDPMPEKADNYVVARAYPISHAQAAAGELGVTTLHFHRNSVKARILKVESELSQQLTNITSNFTQYPNQYIPTPPTLEPFTNGQYAMIALSRKSNRETGFLPLIYSTSSKDRTFKLFIQACQPPFKSHNSCQLDPLTSINSVANIDGMTKIVSLKHQSSNEFGTGGPKLIILEPNNSTPVETYGLNSGIHVNDGYRLLQNDLLLEKNIHGSDTHAWILSRGMDLDTNKGMIKQNKSGDGYEDRLLVIRQPLSSGKVQQTQRFMIDAEETDDPLSLIRLEPGAGVALIGLRWGAHDRKKANDSHDNAQPPLLSLWRLQEEASKDEGKITKSIPIPLINELRTGFIERPPLVFNAPSTPAPVIAWTRVASDPENSADLISLDIVLTELNTSLTSGENPRLKHLGSLMCTINLKQQLISKDAGTIREIINLSLGRTSGASPDAKAEAKGIGELKERWQMSQTIVSTKPSAKSKDDDIAITTIFNGYPLMSFQAVLKKTAEGFSYSHNLPRSPYIDCKRK